MSKSRLQKLNQSGLAHLAIILVVVVVAAVGFVGWKVFSKDNQDSSNTGQRKSADSKTDYIEWRFDGKDKWTPSSTPPDCEDPLVIGVPMDITKATGVLYPGQIRGGDFKPHGGLAADNNPDNKLDILAVRNAYLYQGSRYLEQGEVQYMFDFIDPCGIRYRYDHLATLSPALAKYATQLPEPKPDDSRTTPIDDPPYIKAGTVIATEVGFRKNHNVGFDLGVYDLRQRNAASKTEVYKTDAKRLDDKEQSFFSVCWFDLLPSKEKGIVRSLPARGGEKETNSDYCQI